MRWFKRRVEEPKVFTGNCMVYQHTGDGKYAGRCYHSTYNGVCHLHGDVSAYLRIDALTTPESLGVLWPNDFDIDGDLDLPCGCA